MKIDVLCLMFLGVVFTPVLLAQQAEVPGINASVNAFVRKSGVLARVRSKVTAQEGAQGAGVTEQDLTIQSLPGAKRLKSLFAAKAVSVKVSQLGKADIDAVSLSGLMTQFHAVNSTESTSRSFSDLREVRDSGLSYSKSGQFPDSTRGTAVLSPPLYIDVDLFNFKPSTLEWRPSFGSHPLLIPSYAVSVPLFLTTETQGFGNQQSTFQIRGIHSVGRAVNALTNPLSASELSNSLVTMPGNGSIDDQSK